MRKEYLRVAVRKFRPFEIAIAKQWEGFERQFGRGLKLEIVALDLTPLTQSLFEQDGLRNGSWDIALINTDWIASACERGDLINLAEFIQQEAPEGYPQGWTDSMLRLQQSGSFVAGLPYHDGPECLIYRKDLFEDANEQQSYLRCYGVKLRPPQTWNEFRQVARFFQRPAEGLHGCLFAAYPDGHNTVYDFLLQLWTRGGALVDARGDFTFETPEAESALTFYRQMLADTGAVHPKCKELDSVRSGEVFARGEAAMMINWFGFAAMAELADFSSVRGKVDVAPVPNEPPHPSASLNIYWVLSVAAGSAHREISYQFLRYCASAEMDRLLTLEGAIGCRLSTWADAEVNKRIPFYHRLKELHENACETPRLAEWPKINDVINEMVLAARESDRPVTSLLREATRKVASVFQ